MSPLRYLAPTLLAAAFGLAASASAQTVINSVPYTISASGQYQLATNLITSSPSQTAITITAPNVILDLNQFFVSGPGGDTTSTVPVINVANVSNVTIMNGTVANNGYGIYFTGALPNSINHVVDSVNVTRCYRAGIYFAGTSAGSIVRGNTVSQTGGVGGSGDIRAYGIYTFAGVLIDSNTVSRVTGTNLGGSFGISADSGSFVVRNTVSTAGLGVFGGKYQDNLTLNCTTTFAGGVDATGNN